MSLVASLDVALGLLLEEGLEAAFARHAGARSLSRGREGHGPRAALARRGALGVVTAILTPEGIDARELVLAACDRFGITVGGHGELGSRMFRIGYIGHYDVFDITTALAAVELLLVESGAGRRARDRG